MDAVLYYQIIENFSCSEEVQGLKAQMKVMVAGGYHLVQHYHMITSTSYNL